MQNYVWLCLMVLLCNMPLKAQEDTLAINKETKKAFLPKMIIPATLILSGVLLTGSESEKGWQIDIRNKVGNDYHNSADDYIQYVPYAQIYLGGIIGLQPKNHWFDQTKNIFFSGLATLVITHSLKRGVGKERPDASSKHSFSSGHTATSFVGATILYHEYKDSSPLYAYSGYLFATSTGGLRVMNNKHWVSDVLAGAGIGILVASVVDHIEPLKNWNPFKNSKNLTFSPVINDDEVTFVAALRF